MLPVLAAKYTPILGIQLCCQFAKIAIENQVPMDTGTTLFRDNIENRAKSEQVAHHLLQFPASLQVCKTT